MRSFLYSMLFFLAFIAIGNSYSPIVNNFDDTQALTTEITNMNLNLQPKTFTILTSNPAPSAIQNGQLVLVNISGAVRLYTRVNNSTYSVVLN